VCKQDRPIKMKTPSKQLLALVVVTTLSLPASILSAGAQTIYQFDLTAIDGSAMPLLQYRGKTILLVNTASFCGFTRQYNGLQALWEKYQDHDLIVLGVPSNNFGGQEPKSEKEIAKFCQGAFNVTFPLTKKMTVGGKNTHPLYKLAAQQLGPATTPRWNFHKYIINAKGRFIYSFGSNIEPLDPRLMRVLDKQLALRQTEKFTKGPVKVKSIIDDLSNPHPHSSIGTPWRFVSDTVMGGVSSGTISRHEIGGRKALRLTGNVSLENNGGFVQMALPLNANAGRFNADGFTGIELVVRGNNEPYGLHLRTSDLERPWQSYRQTFVASEKWQVLKFPFDQFERYRTDKKLDLSKLRRLGIAAIGKEFSADVSVARVSLY